MNYKYFIILLFIGISCEKSKSVTQDPVSKDSESTTVVEKKLCNYSKDYITLGNRIVDTIKVETRLIDPIDDYFEATDHGFVKRADKIYKKAKTHRKCEGKFIDVEYYQEFTNRIDLASYKEYNDRYFTTKNNVYFWWVNSGGHLMIPINKADSKTFKPFKDICGGADKKGIYYGCPNYGMYKLNIPITAKVEFIPKEGNYWNSPKHFVIMDNKVYDIKYELDKGYFCERNKSISVKEVLKLK
ncbi:DKNYY domain-containing protein [uncultured Kordia sp.]|uniref:DKNYY domain-containing protein n=1 Tax=uncultured Kordia sp. TaxID=507699 RepID=UPI00261965BD|nr:DKNYY domain-containing protein [uncultured Kordia sp.]